MNVCVIGCVGVYMVHYIVLVKNLIYCGCDVVDLASCGSNVNWMCNDVLSCVMLVSARRFIVGADY